MFSYIGWFLPQRLLVVRYPPNTSNYNQLQAYALAIIVAYLLSQPVKGQ